MFSFAISVEVEFPHPNFARKGRSSFFTAETVQLAEVYSKETGQPDSFRAKLRVAITKTGQACYNCIHERDSKETLHMEAAMDELKWAKLTEVYGRMEADVIESYLEANGIDVELFQEAVGHTAYPTTVDGLARIQVFVPGEFLGEARKMIERLQDKDHEPEDAA